MKNNKRKTIMKLGVLVSLVLLISPSSYAAQEEYAGVEITLKGTTSAPDPTDATSVNQTMGSMVADLWLGKYIVKTFEESGGYSICIEKSPYVEIGDILNALNQITINPEKTTFRFKPVLNCSS
jgi:hypothetical protein